ncbi:MAG TPA: nitroreductase family protein [Acidimicrobiales bacterium]|jgi:nitroreductase
MDTLEALYTTRAMRRLKPDPIPSDVVARILDAGVRAPSPGATQSWRFVAVDDREVMGRLGQVWRGARDALLAEMPNLYSSPVQAASSQYLHDHFDELPLVVFGYGPPGMSATTVVPALWSMCLAARAQGVGSVFTTLLTRSQGEVDQILGVPADAGVSLVASVPMGYPKGRWGVAPRQGAHEVTFANRWGNPPAWRAEPPAG